MAITKRNEYLPDRNLTNLSLNVDDNRLENDQSQISVNFGTTPATVTIKVGSVIEVNGNSYVIDTADETFQMSNASDNYITFTDNPSPAFSSASTRGNFDAQKQGFYQSGNTERTLKWYVNQAASNWFILYDIFNQDQVPRFNDTLVAISVSSEDITTAQLDANNIDTLALSVNNTYSMLEITKVSGSGSSSPITLSYPTGFSVSNTRVLSSQVTNPAGNVYAQGTTGTETTGCRLTPSGIEVHFNLAGLSPWSVEVVIMRD